MKVRPASFQSQGFLLVAVLLIAALLLTLGIGYLASAARNYSAAYPAVGIAQARTLARAGLDDALEKLNKDRDFPPAYSIQTEATGVTNAPFSYSETVTDLDGVTVIGSYQVKVDLTYQATPLQWTIQPNQLLILTSTGLVGSPSSPSAQAGYRLTLNTLNPDRAFVAGMNPAQVLQDPIPCTNYPHYWHALKVEDLSAL